MINNDILRRLRFALSISNSEMAEIFSHSGYKITEGEILSLLKKDDDEGFTPCNDKLMRLFLDGLIINRRGRRDGDAPAAVKPSPRLTNNETLKKLRIALNYKEDDMLEIFRLAEFTITRSELSAIFRKEGHTNYKACGDQIIRSFLQGLTVKYRK